MSQNIMLELDFFMKRVQRGWKSQFWADFEAILGYFWPFLTIFRRVVKITTGRCCKKDKNRDYAISRASGNYFFLKNERLAAA